MHFLLRDWLIVGLFFLACLLATLLFDDGKLLLMFSMTLMCFVFALFCSYLTQIEKRFPLFEVGFFLVGLTFIYCFYPLFAFAASGFEWSIISDNRLRATRMNAQEMAEFSLHHLTYLTFLAVGYSVFRTKKPTLDMTSKLVVDQGEAKVVFLIVIILEGYFIALGSPERSSLPHFVWQVTNALSSVKFVCTLYLAAFAFANWKNPLMRAGIIIYFGFEVYSLLAGNSGRTWLFLHLLAYTMLYHKLVRALSFKFLVTLFLMALIAFIFGGFYRHGSLLAEISNIFFFFSGSNEFTSLFGTNWDLYHRKEIIGSLVVPWQVYWDDLFYLIPSQWLPFEKLSLSQWYLQVIDQYGKGIGFAFGVISQGIVGGGLLELFLRGLLTGFLFAKFHGWYVKRTHLLWALVTYVFIAVKSYYIYRASTAYIFYFVIYHLIPTYLGIKGIMFLLTEAKTQKIEKLSYYSSKN